MKKILLTGGSGYIGSILINYLLSKNYKVKFYSEDYNSNPHLENFYKDPLQKDQAASNPKVLNQVAYL